MILALISFLFSQELFRTIGDSFFQKVLFTLVITGLEGAKLLFLADIKTHISIKETSFWKQIILFFRKKFFRVIVFFLLEFYSLFSTYAYLRYLTNGVSTSLNLVDNTFKIEQINQDITDTNRQIEVILKTLEASSLSLSSRQKYQTMLDGYYDKKAKYLTLLDDLKKEQAEKSNKTLNTNAMFALVAQDVHMSEEQLRFIFLLIMSLAIDVCVIMLSPESHFDTKNSKSLIDRFKDWKSTIKNPEVMQNTDTVQSNQSLYSNIEEEQSYELSEDADETETASEAKVPEESTDTAKNIDSVPAPESSSQSSEFTQEATINAETLSDESVSLQPQDTEKKTVPIEKAKRNPLPKLSASNTLNKLSEYEKSIYAILDTMYAQWPNPLITDAKYIASKTGASESLIIKIFKALQNTYLNSNTPLIYNQNGQYISQVNLDSIKHFIQKGKIIFND
jgi:hypothetical protein